ncbi:hypothetical protein PAP_04435 [Palaeococcus pacificus DY20341]|uniref:Methyltransferase domain-containing protein n=2 Tax=Palaeococcus TaxID=83867 RepID=A0A075LXL7_9EURY|nr:hypothetical protein PAP_04435 [Palaeococcus pacificus DY20341]
MAIPIKNKPLLKSLLDTYGKIGVVGTGFNEIWAKDFYYKLALTKEKNKYLIPDWIPIFEEIYKMIDYAAISPEHPKILMDFDKDADFWDMRLNTGLNSVYRHLIKRIGLLRDGMRVLDLGCGSVSPVEIGRFVGPNGEYVGVDFSPGTLSIAKQKIKDLGLDWVILKEMDIRSIIPKRKYDVVIMSFVLEYIPDIQSVIRKAVQALDENGKLVIVDPFRENYPDIEAWEFFESLTKEFVKFPSKAEIINALEYNGYTFIPREFGKSVLVFELQ